MNKKYLRRLAMLLHERGIERTPLQVDLYFIQRADKHVDKHATLSPRRKAELHTAIMHNLAHNACVCRESFQVVVEDMRKQGLHDGS